MKLEEVCTQTAQGGGATYLSVMSKLWPNSTEKDSLTRLKAVRLALAKYMARSMISGYY
jgi:nuclear pore complex protein Nup85